MTGGGMVLRPSHYERGRSAADAPRHVILLPPAQLVEEELARGNDFSALNALIQDRGARWSKQARAIKFDIEFKAIEKERRRVAKELHDEVLPVLARLIRKIQSQCDDRKSCLIVDELHDTVAIFRDVLAELHPVDLKELGLAAAIGSVCKRYARLTDRCIIAVEKTEECRLSDLQQLCIYRALQVVLKVFSESHNDVLVVKYDRLDDGTRVSIRCIDKSVSDADWLRSNSEGFDAFQSWCATAGAEIRLAADDSGDFPSDVLISVSDVQPPAEDVEKLIGSITRIRLEELETIVAALQEEWDDIINRDCELFKELATLAERRRIASHLGRLIIPQLNRIMESSASLSRADIRHEIEDRISAIEKEVSGVVSDAHRLLVAEDGFVPSIRKLVNRFRRVSMIETILIAPIESDQTSLESISPEAKFAVYRVTQEALNNIEKHSGATQAQVTVYKEFDALVVCIEDDGGGFSKEVARHRGSLSRGLTNIRERAAEIGANVIWSESGSFGKGTMVRISLPC